jgi:hypothetical protein
MLLADVPSALNAQLPGHGTIAVRGDFVGTIFGKSHGFLFEFG